MDEIDRKILNLLSHNARITLKEIADKVALTSPAVAQRIRRMEQEHFIAGYTVRYGQKLTEQKIQAFISISISPKDRQEFLSLAQQSADVVRCHHVTGSYSFIVMVACSGMARLEALINAFQKFGMTSSQIILSTPIEHGFDLSCSLENET